jgi:molybdenum cofactor cytidylyltransferase
MLRAMDAAQSVMPGRVLVVLGAHSLRLRALLARNYAGIPVVKNATWQDGIAGSLLAGVGAVPREARGVLVLLSDQPNLRAASLQRLVDVWQRRPGQPVAAGYAGDFGVPVILPRRLWPQLRSLQGDAGAKAVLRSAGSRMRIVSMPEAAFDVDTSEDRRRVERALQ